MEVCLAWHCPGVETYLDTKKNIVLNIVSLPPLNYPPSKLAVLLVVVLVVVLLSCCCCCLHLLCCCIANTFAAATVGTPPPMLPLPPPPSVGKEDDACYRNAISSPATLAQAVCRVLKSHASLDQPLPAGCVGSKGGDDDGGTNGGSQSRIAHLIGVVLPSPTQGGATATRMVGE